MDYIKITVSGVMDKNNMVQAISTLIQHPDYPTKHSYWDCTEGKMGMGIMDLKEIIGIFRLYKPRSDNFANKSAILVKGELNKSMANVFISMAKILPLNYRVFTDKKKLESFLCRQQT